MSEPTRVWFGRGPAVVQSTKAEERPAPAEEHDSPRRVGVGGFLRLATVVLTFAAMSTLVVVTSQATFSDVTDNTANSATAGDIELVDDDSDSAIFTISDMEPGQTEVDCILVTYQGSIPDPSGVKVYSGGYTDSGDFGTYLNLTIEEGTGGTFGDCTGFSSEATIESGGTLATFDSASTNYATGVGSWDPSGTPATKTYRITLELDSSTPNAEQGESVTGLAFTWEIQN